MKFCEGFLYAHRWLLPQNMQLITVQFLRSFAITLVKAVDSSRRIYQFLLSGENGWQAEQIPRATRPCASSGW